jgi:hypothetical protein
MNAVSRHGLPGALLYNYDSPISLLLNWIGVPNLLA